MLDTDSMCVPTTCLAVNVPDNYETLDLAAYNDRRIFLGAAEGCVHFDVNHTITWPPLMSLLFCKQQGTE
jgi:hypothetical protein